MTAFQLLLSRMRIDFIKNWKLFTYLFDVVITIYILIPAVIAIGLIYRSLWMHVPVLVTSIPLRGWLSFLFISFWLNDCRSFLDQADRLFLIQKRSILKALSYYGILYSVTWTLFLTLLLNGLILPILIKGEGLNFFHIIEWVIYFFLAQVLFLLFKKRVFLWTNSWWMPLLATGIYYVSFVFIGKWILTHTVVFWIISLFLVCANLIMMRTVLFKPGDFDRQAAYEDTLRSKWVRLVLRAGGFSATLPKTAIGTKSPIVFRKSQSLIRSKGSANVLMNQFIKSQLRQRSFYMTYFSFLLFFSLAILFLPLSLKTLAWGFALYSWIEWFNLHWHSFSHSSFLQLFKWKEPLILRASRWSITLLAMPGQIVISALMIWQAPTFFAALRLVVIAIGFIYMVVKWRVPELPWNRTSLK